MESQRISANETKYFHVQLLGGFYMHDRKGNPVTFRTRKLCSLMAYLSFYPNIIHNREYLMELFWPSDNINSSRLSFRVNLTWLRDILAVDNSNLSDIIWSDRDNIMIKSEYLDIDTLSLKEIARNSRRNSNLIDETELSQIVNLYKGALLPFMDEDWIGPERRSMEDDFIYAAMHLVNHYQATERLDSALSIIHKALRSDPYHELFHCKLIEIYSKQGRPSAARKQYLEFERIFREDLGIQPSPESRKSISEYISNPNRNKDENYFDIPSIIRFYNDFSHCKIPSYSKKFIGRELEMEQIQEMILSRNIHLVSLWGEPGVGKTRLAIEIGRHVRSAFPGGVWFVSLNDVRDPQQIALSILKNIHMPDSLQKFLDNSEKPTEIISNLLSCISMVIILDNIDQLSIIMKKEINEILPKSDNSVIITTSRNILDFENAISYHINPLNVDFTSYDFLFKGHSDSLSLLKENILMKNPKFKFNTRANRQLNQLCQKFQGLPLALESVATCVSNLPLHQLNSQIDCNKIVELPDGGGISELFSISSLTKHTIDPSFFCLPFHLQTFLVKLAIFINGWDIESACYICNEENIELKLGLFVNFSLIQIKELSGRLWWKMNELVRIYCVDILNNGNFTEIKERYIKYFLVVSRKFRLAINNEIYSAEYLEEQYHNVIIALKMCSYKKKHQRIYWRIFLNLSCYWIGGHHREDSKYFLKDALKQAKSGLLPQLMSLKILLICAELSIYQGDSSLSLNFFSLINRADVKNSRHILTLIEIDALISCLNSDYESAICRFKSILENENIVKFPKLECTTILNIAQMTISLKYSVENILPLLEKCEKIGELINDYSIVGSTKLLKGRLLFKDDQINASIAEFTDALSILNTSRDLYHQVGVRIYLIDALISNYDYNKAFKEAKIGICMAIQVNDEPLIISFILRICMILIKLERFLEAKQFLNFVELTRSPKNQGIIYEYKELIYVIRNNIDNNFSNDELINISDDIRNIDSLLDIISEIKI